MLDIIVNNFANFAEQFVRKISPSERSRINKISNGFLTQLRSLTLSTFPLEKKTINKEAMFVIMDEAKEMERKALFQAVHGAYEDFVVRQKGLSFESAISEHQISPEQLDEVSHGHVARMLRKLCKAQGLSVTVAELKDVEERLYAANARDKEKLKRCLEGSPLALLTPERIERLRKDLLFVQREHNHFNRDYHKLKLNVLALGMLLSENPGSIANTRTFNLCMLDLKRQALRNPAYQLLKTDETNPCVHFLHAVCLASYANTAAITAYQHVGEEILKQLDAEESPLSHKLRNIYEQCAEGGVAVSNFEVIISRLKNFCAEVGQVVHSVLSNIPVFLHLPRLLQGLFPKEDQRIFYENNPGALYTETLRSHGRNVQAHTVYTPGPTVGFEGSPEFCACLQAMENSQFSQVNGVKLFRGWFYTNLQNIASTLENPQSIATMKLNEEYPFSFWGITIAQNSPMMKGSGDDRREFDDSYKEQFIESLLHRDNYTLNRRKAHPGGGYYFPIPVGQRPQWENSMRSIVEEAFRVIQRSDRASLPRKTVLSAFRDLAHLGLISHYQKMCVDQLAQHAPGDFEILESHICRSGMDRGGEINAELLYAAPSQKKRSAKVMSWASPMPELCSPADAS